MKRRTFGGAIVGLPLAPLLAAGAMAPAAALDPPGAPVMGGSIADVPGIAVGHHTLSRRPTGCTVLLCGDGASPASTCAAPRPARGKRTCSTPPTSSRRSRPCFLSGGSAFGLEAATGVMRYLEERRLGFPVRTGVVPIVPAAILFDLGLGDFAIRPDAEAGYQACMAAGSRPVREGNVGAGAGATWARCSGRPSP